MGDLNNLELDQLCVTIKYTMIGVFVFLVVSITLLAWHNINTIDEKSRNMHCCVKVLK